jgi:hypothetical protein
MLHNINWSCSKDGRVFIVEHPITEPEKSHFSKFYGIHMMCWGSGREITVKEYSSLLDESGWEYVQSFYPRSGIIGVIEVAKAKE